MRTECEGSKIEYMVLFAGLLELSLKEWTKLPVILCEVGWGTSTPELVNRRNSKCSMN